MCVTREKWSTKRLGQSNIDSVVSGHIVPQRPYPAQENIVLISADRKVFKIINGLFATFGINLTECTIASNDLSHFKIKKVRCEKTLCWRKNALFDLKSDLASEEDFKHC
jgi:hypothetical protein